MALGQYGGGSGMSIIFGAISVEGLGDSTFITAARDNPAFTNGVGADGEGWRAKTNDKSGTITITILQTSASNDELSVAALLDENTGNGVLPFLLKDNSGRTLINAPTTWIEKFPDTEFATDKTEREWVLKTDQLNMFVGGN